MLRNSREPNNSAGTMDSPDRVEKHKSQIHTNLRCSKTRLSHRLHIFMRKITVVKNWNEKEYFGKCDSYRPRGLGVRSLVDG